jgi:hypothetical protein
MLSLAAPAMGGRLGGFERIRPSTARLAPCRSIQSNVLTSLYPFPPNPPLLLPSSPFSPPILRRTALYLPQIRSVPVATNIVWHEGITQAQREELAGQQGVTVWFTGLSGASFLFHPHLSPFGFLRPLTKDGRDSSTRSKAADSLVRNSLR